MNINFNICVHTFDKASKIEATLKSEGISYAVKVDDKPSLGSSRRMNGKARKAQQNVGRRAAITKSELAAVVQTISNYPKAPDSDVAYKCNVSAATVGRIRSGTHVLQINGAP